MIPVDPAILPLRPIQIRVHLALAVTLALCACTQNDGAKPGLAGLTVVAEDPSNLPLAGLSPEWTSRFNLGDALFDQLFLESQGLGPVYIRAACASCHVDDARGPGVVRKMVLIDADGVPLPDQSGLPYGHTVRPQSVGAAAQAIDLPEDTSHLLVTVRVPPAVFGRGYIEAVADAEIERIEAAQAERDDGISGRINWVTYASESNPDQHFHAHARGEKLIGRFGLKARIATLDDFAADAFQGDMGITSDLRPDELPNPSAADDELPGIDIAADTVNGVADYMRLLRIPSRKSDPSDRDSQARSAALFTRAQCDVCHVPSLHTVPDYPIPQLADIDAPIYSDLLLHDMGSQYADGLNDYGAGSTEWRTAPLIGMRHLKSYMHDGRVKTIEQAIEQHAVPGSEAESSARAFEQLDADSRAALVKFVSAL
jgi:CxxC motif-containing protein (DUF1111 family)